MGRYLGDIVIGLEEMLEILVLEGEVIWDVMNWGELVRVNFLSVVDFFKIFIRLLVFIRFKLSFLKFMLFIILVFYFCI